MATDSTPPMVSVVIPHYGGTEILGDCLTSLNKYSYPNLEIIVLDNSSPDDSVQFIKSNFPEVNLIQTEYNRGFAGGCNFGAQHAKGEYILIFNNDTTYEPDWIDHLVNMMESNPIISAVQPKIKNYDKRDYFDHAGACGGFMDKYCFLSPGVGFSIRLKRTKVSMMTPVQFSGHPVQPFSQERIFLTNWVDLMKRFLHTWKK